MLYTPLTSLLGGLMLSASTSSLLASQGRVLGISGIAHSVVAATLSTTPSTPKQKSSRWKVATFLGLLAGGAVLRLWEGRLSALVGASVFDGAVEVGMRRVLLAGLAVGLGTKASPGVAEAGSLKLWAFMFRCTFADTSTTRSQLGSGCTSGHMLCGMARFSRRSIIATFSFFSAALLTAQVSPAILPAAVIITLPSLSFATLAFLQLPFVAYTLAPYLLPPSSAEVVTSFFIGLHFSFGLALAGMLAPSKVISFFYLPLPFLPLASRPWDPSLLLVAVGGLLPNMLAWKSIQSWSSPIWRDTWEIPTRKDVNWRMVGGSALFGVGWGESSQLILPCAELR